jgi:hypothetical protein
MESMKKYFLTFSTIALLTFAPKVAMSYDGVVIVLEAPLLKSPDLSSRVLQTLRKGERVFVPREAFEANVLPEFIPTFDRVGNRAYIPTKYVKVITHSISENKMPLTIAGHDPTDYRLAEPIPAGYPFEDKSFLRVSASLLIGNNLKNPYSYNASFNEQDYKNEMGARLAITRKVTFDTFDRFYFGFIGLISSSRNSLDFKNETTSSEVRSVIRGGPILTFDAFKNEKYRLALGTGFTYNFHRSSITMSSNGDSEQRLFSGYSFSPMANSTFQINDMLPNTDFITGIDFSLFLPHAQESKDIVEFPELWPNSDKIKSTMKPQVSLFLGIQVKY